MSFYTINFTLYCKNKKKKGKTKRIAILLVLLTNCNFRGNQKRSCGWTTRQSLWCQRKFATHTACKSCSKTTRITLATSSSTLKTAETTWIGTTAYALQNWTDWGLRTLVLLTPRWPCLTCLLHHETPTVNALRQFLRDSLGSMLFWTFSRLLSILTSRVWKFVLFCGCDVGLSFRFVAFRGGERQMVMIQEYFAVGEAIASRLSDGGLVGKERSAAKWRL